MERIKGKIVVVTVGNLFRGDDGAGVQFGNLIREETRCEVIEGGDAPENVTSLVVKNHPDTILIVDAMDFGGNPGDVRLVSADELEGSGISTHGSLHLFINYLKKETEAFILVLGFQPESVGLGEGLSHVVQNSVKRMADNFIRKITGKE